MAQLIPSAKALDIASLRVESTAVSPWHNPTQLERPASPRRNPTQLERPALLLNFPFSYYNAWIQDLPPDRRGPDFKRAATQFLWLYRYLAAEALVYLLPTPRVTNLQDLVFTANLGIVLEHLPDRNTVVMSKFSSARRRSETEVGVRFFRDMGYQVWVPPTKFEGEAELKHLYDNVYIGGYGTRSERATYDWMERTFDMRVIPVRLVDRYLYQLDYVVFPITRENTLVCTERLEQSELAALEKATNIIPVSADHCYSGICNSVRLSKTVLNSSHLLELRAGTEDYQHELAKNRALEDIAADLGLEVSYFDLSEYHRSGVLLSCMIMHLNRHAYKIALSA